MWGAGEVITGDDQHPQVTAIGGHATIVSTRLEADRRRVVPATGVSNIPREGTRRASFARPRVGSPLYNVTVKKCLPSGSTHAEEVGANYEGHT